MGSGARRAACAVLRGARAHGQAIVVHGPRPGAPGLEAGKAARAQGAAAAGRGLQAWRCPVVVRMTGLRSMHLLRRLHI